MTNRKVRNQRRPNRPSSNVTTTRSDNIRVTPCRGNPPTTLAGGSKWITRWLMFSVSNNTNMTLGAISTALLGSTTNCSLRILRIQAYSPMDAIGQSLTITYNQTALVPMGPSDKPTDLAAVDYGTGSSRAAIEIWIPPSRAIVYDLNTAADLNFCKAAASGASPGATIYRVKVTHTV
jgi:hypothetical protein